jgi:hypothetical protein
MKTKRLARICPARNVRQAAGEFKYESRRDFVLQPRVGVVQPTLGRTEIKFATLKRVVSVLNIA